MNRVGALILLAVLWGDIAALAYILFLPFYLPIWVPLAPLVATFVVPLAMVTWELVYVAVTGRDE